MTRVPKTKSRLKRKPLADSVEFQASPGTRLIAAGLCAVLTAMFLFHQTMIEGNAILLRTGILLLTAFFALLAWYFFKRGSRRGALLRLDKDGFGIALGFDTWLEFPWERVEAFRYWEPTGIALLVKKRQSRWVGILLTDKLRKDLPLDARFEIWLNTFHNRPGFCILHPFVREPILDVLQGFKDYAPKRADDYEWMKK